MAGSGIGATQPPTIAKDDIPHLSPKIFEDEWIREELHQLHPKKGPRTAEVLANH